MPIGLNPKEFYPDARDDFPGPQHIISLRKRPLIIFYSNKIRKSSNLKDKNSTISLSQWDDRNMVLEICKNNKFCMTKGTLLQHNEFLLNVVRYPFLLCVHGGGLGITVYNLL
jgi:hypothetical protein